MTILTHRPPSNTSCFLVVAQHYLSLNLAGIMADREPQRKRPRASSVDESLPTPPSTDLDLPHEKTGGDDDARILQSATRVLKAEARAVADVSDMYESEPVARRGLVQAVKACLAAQRARGKMVVSGVGKSAYIGMKLVATCKSLGIACSFMHAAEAMHGDLGDVGPHDVLLFVSHSGRTPELLNILPHISAELPAVIAMTGHTDPRECPLLNQVENGILLPACIREKEETTFGVAAPTSSTTVALAVADMLALSIAEELHDAQQGQMRDVFARNHPGGAIGINHRKRAAMPQRVQDSAAPLLELPSPQLSGEDDKR